MNVLELLDSVAFLPNTAKGCLALAIGILSGTLALTVFLWFWDPSERSCGLLAVGLLAFSVLLFIGMVAFAARRSRPGA